MLLAVCRAAPSGVPRKGFPGPAQSLPDLQPGRVPVVCGPGDVSATELRQQNRGVLFLGLGLDQVGCTCSECRRLASQAGVEYLFMTLQQFVVHSGALHFSPQLA